jgi:hypothetical protein
MNKTVALAVFGLLVCGEVFALELLVSPGMNSVGSNGQLANTPNAPWVVTASRGAALAFDDGAASEAFADFDGGGFGLFFKAFIGNPPWDPTAGSVDVNIYQDVAGTPGKKYTLTGWWGAEDNYSGFHTPGANTIFALDFFGGSGTLLSSAELDLEAAGLGDPNPGLNYEQFMVSAIAPVGTATVRARGSLIDGVYFQDPGQALVTDTWSLASVPEPTSLALFGLSLAAMVRLRQRARS